MPRRKPIDAVDVILQYAEEATLPDVDLLMKLMARIVGKRRGQTTTPTPRRRRQPPTPTPAAEPVAAPVPAAATPRPTTRRMRANSSRPKNEATPIVPLQAEVGEDDTNDNTGD